MRAQVLFGSFREISYFQRQKGKEIHIKKNIFYPIQQNIGLYLNY